MKTYRFKIGDKVTYEGLIATIETLGVYYGGGLYYGLVADANNEMSCNANEEKCEPYNEGDDFDESETLSNVELHSAHIQNMVSGITDKFFRDGNH